MCGVFFLFDQATPEPLQRASYLELARNGLQHRGPDGTTVTSGDRWDALHCLLSMTGSTPQPVQWSRGVFLFNGELYNDWQRYTAEYGDTDFFKALLDDVGCEAFSRLDGEFALIVLDEREAVLHLVSDTFGTKPLYYAIEGGRVGCASYDFILRGCGFRAPIRVEANSSLTISLRDCRVLASETLSHFDFGAQVVDSFDPFIEAFRLAIKKRAQRAQRGVYVPVSSGHDSGLIAAVLMDLGVPFAAYGFEYAEEADIMRARYEIMGSRGVSARMLEPSVDELERVRSELNDELPPFFLRVEGTEELYGDPDIRNVTGYVAAAYMAAEGRANGQTIALSGQGADEIISDYFNPHSNSRRSYFRGDWARATAPWPNFFGGWNRVFLEANERIVGHYGIETRYPFLDPAVVQAFLNLKPAAKGGRYKGCITRELDRLGFPYHDRKIGFTGYAISGG